MTYKHKSYQEIYEDKLKRFVGKPTTLVELGIGYGGSLQMWKSFLGEDSKIIGIDKNESCCFSEGQIESINCDESDIHSLDIKSFDVFIDDGSHICSNQIKTLEHFFPKMNIGGLYFCEDVHTSYRQEYGGGYKKENTFIEYCKNIIDGLHNKESESIKTVDFINSIKSIEFFRTMVVLSK